MEEIIAQAKAYLETKYKCQTIILYGSYATGSATKSSNLDLLCFGEVTEPLNDTIIIAGVRLDAWIVNSSELAQPQDYLHVASNRVILDNFGQGSDFSAAINRIVAKGPKPLTANRREFLCSWMTKMVKRSNQGDIEGNLRHHWLLTDSLEMYFELQNRWYPGPKKALLWLEQNEKEVYDLFARAFSEPVGSSATRALIEHIINR